MIRTTAPVYPQEPYYWEAASKYQCTWYAYYRAIEEGFTPPCYWDRETRTGSYTNAKEWLKNFREPWQVKGPDYQPVHGDIAVFDGTYGHVIFVEDEAINLISEYNRIAKQTFDTDTWVPGTTLKGCGKLLGYLHYPLDVVNPVARDIHVDQIETTDTSLRIRLEPNLNGKIISHVQLGYYNVLSITEALEEDKEAVEGLECWYEIAPNRYCANITTTFLPKEDDELKRLREENAQLKLLLRQINELSSI